MSKLLRFFNSYSGDIQHSNYNKQKGLVPLIAIPTTAGTGSEATHFAVLYKDKIKRSVAHDDVLPDVAIVYPPFTYNNPKYLTACTGFDALAQAIEAYWNVNATDESDEYALKAIRFLWKNLPEVVNNPTVETRNIVSEGSFWAGKAINITETTAPHAFSYPFTSYYGMPHGHAVSMTFPFWAKLNIAYLQNSLSDKANILLSQLNINENNICMEFINYINNLSLDLHLPSTFSLDSIFDNVNMERLRNNPGNMNMKTIYHAMRTYFMNLVNKKYKYMK
jgi:alcohol dehydrogenase class IV